MSRSSNRDPGGRRPDAGSALAAGRTLTTRRLSVQRTSDGTSGGTRNRATAPVAVVLLVGLCVVLAAGIGAALTSPDLQQSPRYVTMEGEATADGTITLTHTGGAALDVRRLTVTVTVDGTPLTKQPPVPFFSASGFYSGPSGPFNNAADPAWTTGETAGFSVAGTNDPPLVPGSDVVVKLSINEQPIAEMRMTVRTG